jgi:hypothetical protein
VSFKNKIGYYTRCLHCHAEEGLATAEATLAEQIVGIGRNYPGAYGCMQSVVGRLTDPSVMWELCSKHKRELRANRATKDRELDEATDEQQRAWREGQGSS